MGRCGACVVKAGADAAEMRGGGAHRVPLEVQYEEERRPLGIRCVARQKLPGVSVLT